ncbi:MULTISPECIES: 4Fe-4S binding protein [Xanthobacter]|uniref:4Fe-4S binding protein n=1 Tax=Xanthobacter TaxID=279 RepID=UPI0024A6D8DF|nr:4Fe-4S binding protein [Xanthobacter autotrophicus]MDI4658510.1 4Fe-4S binding protein [Xanthobacter autotrophicus]MDI4665303.1 4Fe-4S binding protein [Xanthobacter autotrophicus]
MAAAEMLGVLRSLLSLVLALVAAASASQAGELSREELVAKFSPPFVLGERDADLPIYPIFSTEGTQDRLVGYIFESADLAPIPGFSGTPPNLLITLGVEGTFQRVSVISQHEPVFVDGLGPEPLDRFVEQYAGKSLAQNVKVGPPGGGVPRDGANARIDGVAKATASVRIINESVLAAALAAARAKLGGGGLPHAAATVRPEKVTEDFAGLQKAGLVVHLKLTEGEVEKAFAGSEVAGTDPEALAHLNATFVDIHVAYLNIPTVGQNLLGPAQAAHLAERLDGGHALIVWMGGRWKPFGEAFVHGATPDMIALTQGRLALDLRDAVYDEPLALKDTPKAPFVILRIFGSAGFDPADPFKISFHVTRKKGQIYPVHVTRDFALDVHFPEKWFQREETDEVKGWRGLWKDRRRDLAVLGGALALLGGVLAFQPATMRRKRLVTGFRWGFLTFCLVVIGWIYQAQLSIVTLAGLVKSAIVTRDLTFLLWDPPSLVLWGVAIVTAVIWGRGTFCGWLCPFGALQELVERIARPIGLRQVRMPPSLDRRLRGLKFVVLAGFIAVAVFAPAKAEMAAEVEPFKTAITLVFQRAWPAVLYAGLLLVANLFVFKAFCRWFCPLGALMALLGLLRRFDWIARRVECGSPCRLCERRCRYGAIERSGAVQYSECFQCMECVVIYEDLKTCVPLVLAARSTKREENTR